MLSGYSFRPRLWALVLAAAACGAGIMLGNWQAGRAEVKRAPAARVEPVAVQGQFVPEHTVLLDNKIRRGMLGYEVLTPLRLAGSARYVLVNRGWIRGGATRSELPQVSTPPGAVRVEGVELERLPRILETGPAQRGRVRQSLEIDEFARETGLELEPRIIEQHSQADDGLLREWLPPDAGVEKHEMYALQWYSLAALSVILLLALSFRKHEDSPQ